ncbi:nuclease-related domain-containing protein [[Bacillus] enclensis]|uniref:nuclease-related domain-containing protein n=1 Tax=[Bacillus] enclensis TaxID=1402860 RepID=UPI0018DDCD7D|nr:nuclease-related domain-containing protein [[Bacillus] enclensis]MBH9967926.1 NERD domain-containing protein [[Bacillus] enclensis]
MFLFLHFLKKKKENVKPTQTRKPTAKTIKKTSAETAARKGELGEYKIDIQLDQLPKDCRYLSDLLVKNSKAKSGYSQIDHVVLTPYGIFTIETKNYQGTIYGGKDRKTWLVNGKFKMMNPFVQNYGHIAALKKLIDETYHPLFISMVSFTKRCTFKVGLEYRKVASNELIVYDIELSEFIHRKISVLKLQHKEPLLSETDISTIHHTFNQANITDLSIREEHKLKLSIPEVTNTNSSAACVTCSKPVSAKVQAYCLSNKRFEGKIYCYEHQKTR